MKKIIGMFVCVLLITTTLQITGTAIVDIKARNETKDFLGYTFGYTDILSSMMGDEEDPEITDEENDVVGPLVASPILFKLLTTFGVLDIESLDFVDITSAWFYENSDEPDYLYAAIKLKDLEFNNQRTIYSIFWTYDEKEWVAAVHVLSNGGIAMFGVTTEWASLEIDGAFDTDNNIVAFQIPKDYVGNPEPGDALTLPNAWAGLRFEKETLITVLIGELATDWTGYGRDYTIQY